ncbi:MAG: hypothetical protein ACOCV1_04565 [Bacillota bacterium]
MKFRFEQRLNEKENKYLEKYSKEVAYKKLIKKYSNYKRRIKSYPFIILYRFFLLPLMYYSILFRDIQDNAKPFVIVLHKLYAVFCVIIIIISFVSIILFHYKNKEIVDAK